MLHPVPGFEHPTKAERDATDALLSLELTDADLATLERLPLLLRGLSRADLAETARTFVNQRRTAEAMANRLADDPDSPHGLLREAAATAYRLRLYCCATADEMRRRVAIGDLDPDAPIAPRP